MEINRNLHDDLPIFIRRQKDFNFIKTKLKNYILFKNILEFCYSFVIGFVWEHMELLYPI